KSPGQPAGKYSSNWNLPRQDGASLLYPNLGGVQMDIIMRLGGCDEHWYLPLNGAYGSPNGTTASMETIHARTSTAWVAGAPMPSTPPPGFNFGGGRFLMNAVILPTGGVLVLGGVYRAPNTRQHPLDPYIPVFKALLFENG